MMRTSTCRYCGSSHPPRRCPAYGMMCGECSRVNHFSTMCRAPRRVTSKPEEQDNGQTNKVKNNQFIHNHSYVKASIETKINTTSFYNNIDVRYKLDTGRSNNHIPFHLYRKLFPKATYKYIRQPNTCKLKLMHNEKENICKFFVNHIGSLAVLGMQDIDKIGLLSITIQKTGKWQKRTIKTIVRAQGKQKVTSLSSSKARDIQQKNKTHRLPTILIQQSQVTTINSQLQKTIVAVIPFQKC